MKPPLGKSLREIADPTGQGSAPAACTSYGREVNEDESSDQERFE